MPKSISLALLVSMLGGGWFFFQNFEVEGLEQLTVRRRPTSRPADPVSTPSAPWSPGDAVRVASFNIQVFGETKAKKPEVMSVLADVVQRFDIVAVQEIRAANPNFVPNFVDFVNADGRRYDFIVGERLGRTSSKEQYAFIYDAERIEADRHGWYTIHDPDDLLHRPPLVCHFRVRGPPSDQSFTFTLINAHTDPDEVGQELKALEEAYRAVRRSAPSEDDVILLGDLNANDRKISESFAVSGLRIVFSGVPTNVRKTKLYDNILFHGGSTAEFTGRAGVFDLMREYNLTMDQTLDVSDHLPVWAEFSAHEHGLRANVVARPQETISQ